MNSADSIDPHLLHKDTPRDVLIGRPRLILPSFLSASIGADILAGNPRIRTCSNSYTVPKTAGMCCAICP